MLWIKEAEVDEGSSPGVARQLDFVAKVEPVIRTCTKKAFSQTPAFGDTEASTRSKIMLPQWGHFFSSINWEDYKEFNPYSDPDVRTLDDQVFPNI
jgi:hypothetical protein